jgi:hypothetical protein
MAFLPARNFALFLVAFLNGILLLSIALSIHNASQVAAKQSSGESVHRRLPNYVQSHHEFSIALPSVVYRHSAITVQDLVDMSANFEPTQDKEWAVEHRNTDISTSGKCARRLERDTFMGKEFSSLLKEQPVVGKISPHLFPF